MGLPRPLARRHLEGRHLFVLVGLLLLAGLSVAWAPGPQAEEATVVGEVTNGTPGAAVPTDLSVSLHTFSGMEETGTYTTTVGGDRTFSFGNVRLEEGETVVARAVYQEVMYVSEFATVERRGEVPSLLVTIYETTDDRENVAIQQLHLFVNVLGERVQVGTYAVLVNSGSRTYVGAPDEAFGETWSVELPPDAANLEFDSAEMGARFVPRDRGFADTRPVPPGAASVEASFTYEIPFRESSEVRQTFDVPVGSAVLVLPEGEWVLEGAGLSSEGRLDTQMGAALSYTAGPLDAGEPLAFAVTGRERPASAAPSSGGLMVGLLAVVAAAIVIITMWRSAPAGPVPESAKADVEAIAALDRNFESGQLGEAEYRRRRRLIKARLRKALSDERRD